MFSKITLPKSIELIESLQNIYREYTPLINLMKNVTLLKFDNFSPSLVFSKNSNLGKWILTKKNILLEICSVFYIFNKESSKSSQLNTNIILLAPTSIFKVFLSNELHNILSILTNCCPRTENIDLRNIHDQKTVAS